MFEKRNNEIIELKKKIDIVQVIGQYLTLNKKGNNYWAICPFHSDTKPSLSISSSKQLFNCFSCNTKGDVFNFIQFYKNISYSKAIIDVCDSLNIKNDILNEFKNKNIYDQEKEKYYQINSLASNFFKLSLSNINANEANQYLKSRKITKNLLDYFDVGCALNKNDDLLNALLEISNENLSINMTDLKNVGLAVKSKEKTNFFINRIIFPIHDEYDNIVAFSGRAFLNNSDVAKYKNTETTKIFKKDQVLYNYNRVKKNNDYKYLFLCEGFMDVIALHSIDISNAVALMGLNLSDYHIELLKKLKNIEEIVISLDNDQPGKDATIVCAQKLLSNNFKVSIFIYPDNNDSKDLDELINKSDFKLTDIINAKKDYFEYLILETKKKLNQNLSINDLTNSVEKILIEIKTYANQITWNKYIDLISKTFDLSANDLQAKFNQIKIKNNFQKTFDNENYVTSKRNINENILLTRIKEDCIKYKEKIINLEVNLITTFFLHKKALIEFNNLIFIKNTHLFFQTICLKLSNLYTFKNKITYDEFLKILEEIEKNETQKDYLIFKERLLKEINYEKIFANFGFNNIKKTIIDLHTAINLYSISYRYLVNFYENKNDSNSYNEHIDSLNKINKKNKEFYEKIMKFNK
ncbi:DNA primase [Mycoplasmoides pirum]|uniref:DNA primase n=1 Tax=Mycoplasmoides pirum TaxID=2122 RepID=UPI00055ED4E3|nr:DNA primase [Mycoplasmoides pirum]